MHAIALSQHCDPITHCRLKSNDKLPAFLDRNFHPHQPSPSQLKHQSQAAQVNGPQQYKYFRRPHLPPGMRATVPLHLAPPDTKTPPQPQPPEPLIKDAATQSDYRESETQTLPWSPDWVLPSDKATLAKQALLSRKYDCQGPEVLQLADLKFGDGLPGEQMVVLHTPANMTLILEPQTCDCECDASPNGPCSSAQLCRPRWPARSAPP